MGRIGSRVAKVQIAQVNQVKTKQDTLEITSTFAILLLKVTKLVIGLRAIENG